MLSKEEIEKAKRICRLLCGKKNKKGKREYETFTRMQMQIDYTVDQMAEAIETVLQELENKDNEIRELKAVNLMKEYRIHKMDIPKKKIEDKIKEYEELVEDFEKTDNSGRFVRTNSIDYYKLEAFKELLEDR